MVLGENATDTMDSKEINQEILIESGIPRSI